jgi:hypothetical protein
MMRKYIYLILLLIACTQADKNVSTNAVKYIVIKDYFMLDRITPILIISSGSHHVDTTYYDWDFHIIVNNKILESIKKESYLFKENLHNSDSTSKNRFHVEVCYDNIANIDTIELPMEKGVEYFNLLIKILEKNKIKDLDIAVKKLNYMKD